VLPALPPKQMFGNFAPSFLERRRCELELYLHHLVGVQGVGTNSDFTSFLGADQGGHSGMTAFDWNYRTGGSRAIRRHKIAGYLSEQIEHAREQAEAEEHSGDLSEEPATPSRGMARHRPLEEWLGIALSRNGSASPSRGMARHRPLEEWLGIALSRNGSAH
jgi:hypothetical protein